ncbi:MAG: bifunctional folylpolyglutamate synthase/dihydrofolate synthase [Candidatus Gastranaerophilales bacterium]|nr:bifunctional folylpolyglutamate synthase/dihydrofolate synthase [Candidatus Gastranaerophilales bacterium]
MEKNFQKAINVLNQNGKFYIELGLDRIKKVLELFENPQESLKIIHIAGTNGKGSTCAMLAELLKIVGLNVGLYTSPHILSYCERIRINDKNIEEDDLSELIFKIEKVSKDNNTHLTEFELLTVAAFLYFKEKNADVVILETGLGGRFDATNVVKKPILTIITSISIDHKDRLGDTIDKIAFEKAGIIKENVPLVVSENNLGFNVIQKVASEKHAQMILNENDIELIFKNNQNFVKINGKKECLFNLFGLWQTENLNLVVNAFDYLKNNLLKTIDFDRQQVLENSLKNVKWDYRFQFINSHVILDGAHNLDAAIKLRKSLDFYFKDKKIQFIYGSLNTKEYEKIVKVLFGQNDDVFLYDFNCQNAVKASDLEKIINRPIKILNKPEVLKIINKKDKENEKLTIVCGSFYMLGEIFEKKPFEKLQTTF